MYGIRTWYTIYISCNHMKRINLNLPEEMLARLDAYCKRNFTNRTEVVKRALLEFFSKEEKTID
jgi:metal-responsive CopG/Arc/MetJ family transcriptional regulator